MKNYSKKRVYLNNNNNYYLNPIIIIIINKKKSKVNWKNNKIMKLLEKNLRD